MLKRFAGVTLLFATMLIPGCEKEASQPAPHGYRIVETNLYTRGLWPPPGTHPGSCIVGPKIEEYEILNDRYVVGRAVSSPNSELADVLPSSGLFILDTVDGVLRTNLSQQEWDAAVRELRSRM